MVGCNFRKATRRVGPQQFNAVAKAVSQSRSMRPGPGLNMVTLPWGQSTYNTQFDKLVAYTDPDGVSNATIGNDNNGNPILQFGTGNVFPTYIQFDYGSDPNNPTYPPTIELSYSQNQNYPLPVYNIDSSTTPVAGSTWVIIEKFYNQIWIVTWELCPTS